MAFGSPSSLVGLLALAGRLACLIVIAWFVVFAVDQTGSASAHQQGEVGGPASTSSGASGSQANPATHESSLHRKLNDTAEALTSPFSGVVSGSQSQWTIHVVETVLALLVYGLGIGFLVRFVRVRV
jgi:hypothetical protein